MVHIRLYDPISKEVLALAKQEQRTAPKMVAILIQEALTARKLPAETGKRKRKEASC